MILIAMVIGVPVLQNILIANGNMIELPFITIVFSKIAKAKTELYQKFNRKPTNAEIAEVTGIDMNKRPKDMTFQEAEAVVQCFKKMKFMAPPTDGLIPIGSEQIEKGMKQILKPEFVTTITRKPVTYQGGVSFIIEAQAEEGMKEVNDTATSLPNANEVTSEDKGSIEDALKVIEELLSEENVSNLTAEEKANIEKQKAELEEK